MSQTQRKAVEYTLMILGAAMTMAFSVGIARRELDGKEDASAHTLDMARLGARMDLRDVRDSAARAEDRRMLRDVACTVNPNRSYCKDNGP